jgi:hypothetical protein
VSGVPVVTAAIFVCAVRISRELTNRRIVGRGMMIRVIHVAGRTCVHDSLRVEHEQHGRIIFFAPGSAAAVVFSCSEYSFFAR